MHARVHRLYVIKVGKCFDNGRRMDGKGEEKSQRGEGRGAGNGSVRWEKKNTCSFLSGSAHPLLRH